MSNEFALWCGQFFAGEEETDESGWNGHEVMARLNQVGVNWGYYFCNEGEIGTTSFSFEHSELVILNK